MEGITIIATKELDAMKKRLEAIESNQLALMKIIRDISAPETNYGVPGYISIKDACIRYKTSHVTINNKIKLFAERKSRQIDRLNSGSHKLINEAELQEALRMRGGVSRFLKSFI